MQALSFSFSSLKHQTVYWHDHIGLCCLLKASQYTNLDSYSLVAICPRPTDPHAYDTKVDEVYLLPTDRAEDLKEVPDARCITREDAEKISAKTVLSGISAEAFKLSAKSYFVLGEASLAFIEQMTLRHKSPNHSKRDTNDLYKTGADFLDQVDSSFKVWDELGKGGDDLSADEKEIGDEELIILLQRAAMVLDARDRAAKRNLDLE